MRNKAGSGKRTFHAVASCRDHTALGSKYRYFRRKYTKGGVAALFRPMKSKSFGLSSSKCRPRTGIRPDTNVFPYNFTA